MKKVFFLLTFISLILSYGFASSQARPDSTEYNLLIKNIVRKVIFPRSISESCKSSAGSLVILINNNKINGNIKYSENFPVSLRSEVEKNRDIFENIKWTKIFPSLKGKTTYNILIPLVYYFDTDCSEKISSAEFADLAAQGLTFANAVDGDTRIVKPVVIKLTKPRP